MGKVGHVDSRLSIPGSRLYKLHSIVYPSASFQTPMSPGLTVVYAADFNLLSICKNLCATNKRKGVRTSAVRNILRNRESHATRGDQAVDT